MPTPASADIRCSTVEIDAPSSASVDDSRVSPTFAASAGMLTGGWRSVRWKAIPASAGAGRSVNSTRAPVCSPTPVVRIVVLSVRWRSIVSEGSRREGGRARGRSVILASGPRAA